MHTDLNNSSVLLIGAGGHGKVVLDALFSAGFNSRHIFVYDENKQILSSKLLDMPVSFDDPKTLISGKKFHISIGNCIAREKIAKKMMDYEGYFFTIVHPSAVISSFASIAGGTFIAANSIVAPGSYVGAGTILNHGCIIDHDCLVGSYSHVAPLATLGGGVKIGDRVLIGAGANILPGLSIGNDAVIGAGALVSQDVAPHDVVVGVPAKSIK